MDRMKIAVVLAVAILAAALAPSSQAQSGRTLEELKAEAQARADRHAYPLAGLKPDDVREALARDPVIFKRVTMPWLLHALELNPS